MVTELAAGVLPSSLGVGVNLPGESGVLVTVSVVLLVSVGEMGS